MLTTKALSTSPDSPVFILTASRSGSTLLRFILDSHPDFACPPETGVPAACAQLARAWGVLENAGSGELRLLTGPLVLSPRVAAAVRAAIDDAYGDYLRARGKPRWCDKSLDAYQFADVLAQVYPDAKFIVLTRHCMDVVASGVEICPWGVSRFGFDPYVAQNPGNSVAAIGSYWLACTQATLAFAEKHPDSCLRVRYEDLVTAPEETAAAIFSFLGAAQAPGIADAAFRTPHEADGPGDEKIWFTSGVSEDSVGRGYVVPAAALPPPLREPINKTLAKLDYRTIGDDWNAAVGPSDPRADAPEATGVGNGQGKDLKPALQALAARIASRQPAELAEIAASWAGVAGTTVRLIVRGDDGAREEIRWSFPAAENSGNSGTVTSGEPADRADTDLMPMVIAPAASWLSVLDGRSNFVTEMTAGRLRCVNPNDTHRLRSGELHAVAALLGVARIPVAHKPAPRTVPGPSRPAGQPSAPAAPHPAAVPVGFQNET
ncbi:MAG: sulfotransferase [Streptosporangiaceae bacterium]|nr:sulfotransferase [Streptosporangiaceae bacterium]MBV9855035.1 sulfotransferase [Streptosporangiaceae bacterium]